MSYSIILNRAVATAAVFALTGVATAQSTQANGDIFEDASFKYGILDEVQKTVAIIDSKLAEKQEQTKVTVPETVTHEGNTYTVTEIRAMALNGHQFVKEFVLPETITYIGERAFLNCLALEKINMPNSLIEIDNAAFSFCRSLASVKFGTSLKKIGEKAFQFCHALTSVEFQEGLEEIGKNAFWYCTLETVNLPKSLTQMGEGCFTVNETEHTNIKTLKSINVHPDNPNYASVDGVLFNKDITKLIQYPIGKEDTEYSAPSTVTIIGASAFEQANLHTITLDESVTHIEDYAVTSCPNLTIFNFPDSLVHIGEHAFSFNEKIESVRISPNVTEIGPSAFSTCKALNDIQLPQKLQKIQNSTFANCEALENIEIPDSVTEIEDSAFNGCNNLKAIKIPDSVTKIGAQVFQDNEALEDVELSKNLTEIGKYSFDACNAIREVRIHASTPPKLGEGVFRGVFEPDYNDDEERKVPLKVPTGAAAKYRNAPQWDQFQISVDPSLETNEEALSKASTVSVYPNPATGTFFIKTDKAETATLLNIEGKLIRTLSLKADTNTINITGLPAGVYFVVVGGKSHKLIVK